MPQNAKSVNATHFRQLRLIPETVPGTLNTNGAVLLADDLNAPFTVKPVTGRKAHNPQGANGAGYVARHRAMSEISGLGFDPDYNAVKKWLDGIFGFYQKRTEGGQDIYVWRKTAYGLESVQSYTAEMGAPTNADRAALAMISEFSIGSGKKNEPSGSLGMFAQKLVKGIQMTGGVAQNHKFRVTAANVSTPILLSIVAPGLAAKNVSLAIGNSVAQNIAAFAAQGLTVASTGTVAAASGETHRLTATNATGNATIYDTITVTPAMTSAALKTAIQAKGGNYANVNVSGSTSAIVAGTDQTNAGTGAAFGVLHDGVSAALVFDNSTGDTTAFDPNQFAGWDFGAGQTRTINRVRLYGLSGMYPINAFRLEASATGAFTGEQTTVFERVAGSNLAAGWTAFDFTSVTARAFRLINTNGSISQIPELEFIGGGSNSNGTYVIEFPANVGDVADITATPGTNWTTTNTQPGNAGGILDFEFTTPANALVSVSKTSGDGYAISTVQRGSNGEVAPLPVAPITASDWGVKRKLNYADLAAASILEAVYNQSYKVSDIHKAHFTANGGESFDRFVTGKREGMIEISMDDSETGDFAAIEDGADNRANRVSQAAWWEIGYKSGDVLYALAIRMFGAVADDIEQDDEEDVEGRKFSVNEIVLGTGQTFSTEIELRVPAGTFAD